MDSKKLLALNLSLKIFLMLLIFPVHGSSVHDGVNSVQVDYTIPQSGQSGGGGGGGGGVSAVAGDGVCNIGAGETAENSPDDCATPGKLDYSILPIRVTGFVQGGATDKVQFTLQNPNSEEITVILNLTCTSANSVFCNYIGFQVPEQGFAVPGTISFKVPAGSEDATGKAVINMEVKFPEGVTKRRYEASLIFSGDDLVTKAVPIEYSASKVTDILFSPIREVQIGRLNFDITLAGILLVASAGGAVYIASSRRNRKRKFLKGN